MTDRALIVNADDFGLTAAVNRGVIRAHEHGIVTSSSLMVRAEEAHSAARYAREHPVLSVGLHLDLYEWSFRNESWECDYQVVDPSDAALVAGECERQVAMFHELVGRAPSHLDAHQHAHQDEPMASAVASIARQLRVPIRNCDPRIRFRGEFYGQSGKGEPFPEGITLGALEAVIESLSEGWSELGCHPGEHDDTLRSMYCSERAVELAVLCDPQASAMLERHGVRLGSYFDVPEDPS